jgi:hypothetical protein
VAKSQSLLTLALLCVSASASATGAPDSRDHAVPCRPTVSCIADLATPGTLELEVGYYFATSNTAATRNVPFLFKQTVSKLFQLQLGSNGLTGIEQALGPRTTYFDNVIVGAKLHLLDQGKVAPSLAITALVGLPPYQNTQHVNAFVTGHASKDVGPIHADLNLGLSEFALDTTPVSQAFAALALSTSLPPPFGIALETYYFSDGSHDYPHDGGVRMALSMTPRPWLVFDFGGDVGYFPSVRSYSVFFGMSIVPVVFWR